MTHLPWTTLLEDRGNNLQAFALNKFVQTGSGNLAERNRDSGGHPAIQPLISRLSED